MKISQNLFSRNITFFELKNPELAKKLKECGNKRLHFSAVTGRSKTISIYGVQLSSRHDPAREAQLQVSSMNELEMIYLYGVGLGFLPEHLLKRTSLKRLKIKVLNLSLFALILSLRDQTAWLCDKRVDISLASLDVDVKFPHFVFPPDLLLVDEETRNIKNILSTNYCDQFSSRQFKLDTPFLLKRIQDNSKNLERDKGVEDLTGIAKFKKAVVVGAGPSLEFSISILQSAYFKKNRPIIISVGTATKLLVNAGIVPDYVVIVDKDVAQEHPLVANFLEMKSACLIYSPLVSPALIESWKGDRHVAYSDSPLFDNLKLTIPKGTLFSGGSVIHTAIDLARCLGCECITLHGVDFAYNDSKTHAGHNSGILTNYENISPPNNAKRFVRNGYGDNVPTHDSFIAYLVELERYIKIHPKIQFWNASRMGANISGCSFLRKIDEH